MSAGACESKKRVQQGVNKVYTAQEAAMLLLHRKSSRATVLGYLNVLIGVYAAQGAAMLHKCRRAAVSGILPESLAAQQSSCCVLQLWLGS
jgi:hypothetical protein